MLHYIPGFLIGGIEARLLDWYKAIDRDKIQFDVLKITKEEDTELIQEFKELGGNVYTISKFSPRTFIQHIKDIKEFFHEHNDYSIVHSHALSPFVLREARKNRIKIRILHARTTNFNPGVKMLGVRKFLKKISPHFATHFFACSKEAGLWAFGRNKDGIKIINNGIQLEKYIFNEVIREKIREEFNINNKFVIGNVGRFSSQKNMEFLIEIFAEVKKRETSALLFLIGDGPEKQKLLNRIKEFHIESDVIFAGQRKNVYDFLQSFDVFVMPSHFEGFGTTALEAQAAGLITFVSDTLPDSIKITSLIKFLPLKKGAKYWAENILKNRKEYNRENMFYPITKAGFNNNQTSKWLESFYSCEVNNSTL